MRGASSVNPEPALGLSFGRKAVLMGGVVQSVDPEDAGGGYWEAMLPEGRPESALVLGLGGGTIALLLRDRLGVGKQVCVDESAAMLRLAENEFGVSGPEIQLVQADAFGYVHTCEQRFDFIAVDLYHENRLARGVLALPFLRALAARLQPGGTVAYNLFRDEMLAGRLARIERTFERIRLVDVAANTVFHGRSKRRQR